MNENAIVTPQIESVFIQQVKLWECLGAARGYTPRTDATTLDGDSTREYQAEIAHDVATASRVVVSELMIRSISKLHLPFHWQRR